MSADQIDILRPTSEISWKQRLLRLVAGLFVFETISGLVVWLLPFSVSTEVTVLFHTAVGLVFIVPFIVSQFQHFPVGWSKGDWFQKWLGVTGCGVVSLAIVSGLVLTLQATLGSRISYAWHYIHLVGTVAMLPIVVFHITPLARKLARTWRKEPDLRAPMPWHPELAWAPLALVVLSVAAILFYAPVNYLEFPLPASYVFTYGQNPFAPSLAMTTSG